MTTRTSLELADKLGRTYADTFARQRCWDTIYLSEPDEDLKLFFDSLLGKHILDAGCGWGRYVYRFIEHGCDYIGLDYSPLMLEEAQSLNPSERFVCALFRSMPFPNEQFAGIWSCCTLSSTPKQYVSTVLNEHSRVLMSGGVLYVVMPIPHEGPIDVLVVSESEPDKHLALYDLREFEEYLTSAGFDVVYSGYRYHSGSLYVLARKRT